MSVCVCLGGMEEYRQGGKDYEGDIGERSAEKDID